MSCSVYIPAPVCCVSETFLFLILTASQLTYQKTQQIQPLGWIPVTDGRGQCSKEGISLSEICSISLASPLIDSLMWLCFLQKEGAKSDGEKKSGGGDAAVVVMKMNLHCDECAKKVKKLIANFNGTHLLLHIFGRPILREKNIIFLCYYQISVLSKNERWENERFWVFSLLVGWAFGRLQSDWMCGEPDSTTRFPTKSFAVFTNPRIEREIDELSS